MMLDKKTANWLETQYDEMFSEVENFVGATHELEEDLMESDIGEEICNLSDELDDVKDRIGELVSQLNDSIQ